MKTAAQELYYIQGQSVPETPAPGDEPKPWDHTAVVGKPLPRVDAYQRTSAAALFPSDISFPDMLFGVMLGSPHANAVVQGIDTTAAEKLAGVRGIITNATPAAQITWRYPWGPGKSRLFDPYCRYEGDAVAAVAAETPYQAWDAARAIVVTYRTLPFVGDERRALETKAPLVHGKDNRVGNAEKYARGDVEQGFAEADVVVEHSFRTACEIHTPLEAHGCVAKWDGDLLTIWESTQGVYAVQEEIASALNLPLAKVRVIGHYMGGGFGSKLEAGKYSVAAAILAKITGRPVKFFLTREQTVLVTGNRPPANMTLKIGAKKDGTLTALDFTCLGTGGAYPANGVRLVDWVIRDLYLCPNVRCESTDVYTNAGPARPFRAPGHPQGAWALEQTLDQLAVALTMDPVDLRLKNIPLFSQERKGNPQYTSTGLRACIEEGARVFGWKEARSASVSSPGSGHIRTGVGMAAATWMAGGGGPPSTIVLKLFSDGSANLNMGASDLGTGTKTVMAMVVSEELGLRSDMIQIESADTGTTQYATRSGGSKTVPTEAPAVRAAAIHVKQQLLRMAADDIRSPASNLTIRDGDVVVKSDPSKRVKITKIAGLKKSGVIVGIGYRGPNPAHKAVNPFAAQFCEVQVNIKTGEVRVLRFVAAHDSGRVMNRLTYDNQVAGGIVMGLGFALTEARVLDQKETGKVCNRNWIDYKLPSALDVPADITSVPIDLHDTECNSTGAKGLGEPVTIPTAAAIANAIYHATGIRVTDTPANPVQLSELLAQQHDKR